MVKLIDNNTRNKLQDILKKIVVENPEFQKAVAFKRTDGMVYAYANFSKEELEKFTVSAARALTGSVAISHAVGRNLDKLILPNSIIIVPAGTTTLLAVVIDPEQNLRSMADRINRKIDKAIELIRKVMG